MSKLLYVLPLALTLCAAPAQARKKKNETPPAKVEKKAPIVKGFFGVQREKEDLFFVIPDSLLRRPMLVTTRFISTPLVPKFMVENSPVARCSLGSVTTTSFSCVPKCLSR